MMKMIAIVVLAALVGLAAATNFHPLSDQAIHHINSKATTWKAGRNFHANMSMESIRRLMGVHPEAHKYRLPELPVHEHMAMLSKDAIPESFDARTQWPNCPSVKEIRDQGGCGSCWAFGAVEAMSDRTCIATDGRVNFHYSAQDLVSCCHICGLGCNGGFPGMAWKYWVHWGIVSGGNYNEKEGCVSYKVEPTCKPSSSRLSACDDTPATPACTHTCQDGYATHYKQDRRYGKTAYSVANNVEAIQREIMTNGPVEVTITVYDDFMNYKSGVYQRTSQTVLGGHAIRMLGWGVENGTPYWLLANSWNTYWGDEGFFKIIRGKDECGVESSVTAGLPKV